MFTIERIERLDRVLRSGSSVEQTVAAQVVSQACRDSGISAHQFAETIISVLESNTVTADAARTQLLAALLQCHTSLAVPFERVRELLFSLVLRQVDQAYESSDTVFLCALIDEAAEFAGAGETGILAAIADAHPSPAVKDCAGKALARVKPSLVDSWKLTIPDLSTPRMVRIKAAKDALFGYTDTRMAAQAMFNCAKGERIEVAKDNMLSLLTFALADSNDTLRLAAALIILVDCATQLPEWNQALQMVAGTAVSTEANARAVYEAVQILQYTRQELPEAAQHIEDAVTRANESYISQFDQPPQNSVSKKDASRLYTDGNGFSLTVNC